MLVFSTKLCDLYSPLLPLSFFLSGSTLPPPFPVCISILYSIQCVKGKRVWGSGPQTDKHLPQIPLTGQFFQMTTFCIAFYISSLCCAKRCMANSSWCCICTVCLQQPVLHLCVSVCKSFVTWTNLYIGVRFTFFSLNVSKHVCLFRLF